MCKSDKCVVGFVLVKMDFRVCGEIYSSSGFFNRVPWYPSVPQNMWWGYVSFKSSVKFLVFFRENDYLLQYVDASL